MWHSTQVSQKQYNNQRTPLQQTYAFAQHDAAAAASSGSNWAQTPLFGGSGSSAGSQQYAPSGGLLLPAQFALISPGPMSGTSLHHQATLLGANMSQQQQTLSQQQQYSIQGQPIQQSWTAPQAWAVQQQLAPRQHAQHQRQHQHEPLQQQHPHQHVQQHQQQQQLLSQHLQQHHHQQPQQMQQHMQASLAPHPTGGRGWGGQSLPYPRHGGQATDPTHNAGRHGAGRGRAGCDPRYGGGGSGRSSHSGPGRSSGRGGSAAAGSHSDALVMQLFMAIRQLPRGQAPKDAVAGRLAALDGRGLAMLLKQLANNGLTAAAWELFDWLRSLEPGHELGRLLDVFAYTSMISMCSSNRGDMELALALSREMAARGVPRNVHTFSALMNVCIKAGQHQAALDVWRELQETGCRPNVVTYNTLIDAYGKSGLWAEALRAFAKMKEEGMEPVTRTYNTLMIACNCSNQWHEALGVYNQMLAAGHTPNTTTYNALITIYSKAGRLEKVMETLREMEAAGCERTVITYSALIAACERDGQWELALQMFGQMLREGCIPNIITYNSLITALAAGAQWERAADVFLQLQRQGCEPDVVTYTALINAYQKGGQWRRALQAFDRMLHHGCRTDHVVFSAAVDALWDSGVVTAQARAARISRAAMSANLIKPIATTAVVLPTISVTAAAAGGSVPSSPPDRPPGAVPPGVTGAAAPGSAIAAAVADATTGGGAAGEVCELHLAALATGSAVVTFLAFLADQRDRAVEVGPNAALPPRVILRFARSRGSGREGAAVLLLRDALHNWLQVRGSPFRLVQDNVSSATAPRMEAAGPDLAGWLLEDSVAIALLPYARVGAAAAAAVAAVGPAGPFARDPMAAAMDGSEDEVVHDAELEVACRDLFDQVRRFEATHCLSVAAMGAPYLGRRHVLAADLLHLAGALQLPRDVAHDAVLLLDRLMSAAAPQLREDLLAMASVTALRILAVGQQQGVMELSARSGGGAGGGRGSGGMMRSGNGGGSRGAQTEAELDARLVQITGLPTLGFQSMELNFHSALAGDTAAISALRCLRLYLRRLGQGGESLASEDIQDRTGPSLQALMDGALRDLEFLNYRPSATAAAALYCHRLRCGSTPLWPTAVALLTGYADLEHPELAAAVGAVQRLIMEFSTGRNRGGVSSSSGASGGDGDGCGGSPSAASAAAAQMAALRVSN